MDIQQTIIDATNNVDLMWNVGAFAIGLIVHVAFKLFTHEISLKEYLGHSGARTAMSGGSLLVAFSGISIMMPEATWVTYLFAGYSIDYMMNKSPMSEEVAISSIVKSKKKK